jgi:hypothetical protein
VGRAPTAARQTLPPLPLPLPLPLLLLTPTCLSPGVGRSAGSKHRRPRDPPPSLCLRAGTRRLSDPAATESTHTDRQGGVCANAAGVWQCIPSRGRQGTSVARQPSLTGRDATDGRHLASVGAIEFECSPTNSSRRDVADLPVTSMHAATCQGARRYSNLPALCSTGRMCALVGVELRSTGSATALPRGAVAQQVFRIRPSCPPRWRGRDVRHRRRTACTLRSDSAHRATGPLPFVSTW